jgi:hypothetical protein
LTFNTGFTGFQLGFEDVTTADNKITHEALWQGKINIDIHLFKGANFSIDILDILITKGNRKLSSFLSAARNQTREGIGIKGAKIGAGISVDLKGSGGISGSYSIERSQVEFTSTGKVKGSLDLELEGKVEGKLEVLWITAEAGAKLSAETGISAELKVTPKDDTFDYEGDINFSGIIIKYAVYAKLEIKKDDIIQEEEGIEESIGLNTAKKASIEKTDEAEKGKEFILVKPFSLLPELGGDVPSFRGHGASGSWSNGASGSW